MGEHVPFCKKWMNTVAPRGSTKPPFPRSLAMLVGGPRRAAVPSPGLSDRSANRRDAEDIAVRPACGAVWCRVVTIQRRASTRNSEIISVMVLGGWTRLAQSPVVFINGGWTTTTTTAAVTTDLCCAGGPRGRQAGPVSTDRPTGRPSRV